MIPDYDRAARMAHKSLLSLHINQVPINPLPILMHCRNTRVRTYDEICPMFGISSSEHFKYYVMAGKEAMTVQREKDGVIYYEVYYDAHAYYYRRRFTLAHELGHIVLKHTQEEPFEEKEADYYASQLLAPSPLVALCNPEYVPYFFGLSNAASKIATRQPRHRQNKELAEMLIKQFDGCFDLKEVAQ